MSNNLNSSFSFIRNDPGYEIMRHNWKIDKAVPYKDDIDPRLVRFLRDLLYHKISRIKPCVPLYMKYQVKKEDWDQIVHYIKKYRVSAFYKCNFNKTEYAGGQA